MLYIFMTTTEVYGELKKVHHLNGNTNPKCSKAMQLADLKGAYLYFSFHFLNRGYFLNG